MLHGGEWHVLLLGSSTRHCLQRSFDETNELVFFLLRVIRKQTLRVLGDFVSTADVTLLSCVGVDARTTHRLSHRSVWTLQHTTPKMLDDCYWFVLLCSV